MTSLRPFSSLTYRELESAEVADIPHIAWAAKLVEAGDFRVMGAVTPENEVVATQGLMQMMHWEGLWIDKMYRGIPVIQEKLSAKVHDLLQALGVGAAFTIALDNQPSVVKAIELQGGTYIGRLYAIPTRKE